jgi:hypothetical protein
MQFCANVAADLRGRDRKIFPVPSKIHNATEGGFNHTGGKAVITKGLQDLFD